jgi:hypothetical protein
MDDPMATLRAAVAVAVAFEGCEHMHNGRALYVVASDILPKHGRIPPHSAVGGFSLGPAASYVDNNEPSRHRSVCFLFAVTGVAVAVPGGLGECCACIVVIPCSDFIDIAFETCVQDQDQHQQDSFGSRRDAMLSRCRAAASSLAPSRSSCRSVHYVAPGGTNPPPVRVQRASRLRGRFDKGDIELFKEICEWSDDTRRASESEPRRADRCSKVVG